MQEGLLDIYYSTVNHPAYFAQKLNDALGGMGTSDGDKGNLTHFWRKVQINEYGKASETVRIQCDGSYEEREGYECYEKSSEVYIANVCQCDENMWNGANSLFFTTVLAVFVPLFARIWKYI